MAAVLAFVLQFVLAVIQAVDVNYTAGRFGIAISTRAWFWITGAISVTSFAATLCLIELYWQNKKEKKPIE